MLSARARAGSCCAVSAIEPLVGDYTDAALSDGRDLGHGNGPAAGGDPRSVIRRSDCADPMHDLCTCPVRRQRQVPAWPRGDRIRASSFALNLF